MIIPYKILGLSTDIKENIINIDCFSDSANINLFIDYETLKTVDSLIQQRGVFINSGNKYLYAYNYRISGGDYEMMDNRNIAIKNIGGNTIDSIKFDKIIHDVYGTNNGVLILAIDNIEPKWIYLYQYNIKSNRIVLLYKSARGNLDIDLCKIINDSLILCDSKLLKIKGNAVKNIKPIYAENFDDARISDMIYLTNVGGFIYYINPSDSDVYCSAFHSDYNSIKAFEKRFTNKNSIFSIGGYYYYHRIRNKVYKAFINNQQNEIQLMVD